MIASAYEQKWSYRQLFVQVVKNKKESIAYITNDGWYVDEFYVEAKSEQEFQQECESYLNSERFDKALKKQRGY